MMLNNFLKRDVATVSEVEVGGSAMADKIYHLCG
jgi:hypothetical protein